MVNIAVAMGLLWLSTVPLTNGTVATIFGVGNLSMLGFFKYFNFFAGSLQDLLGCFDITLQARFMNIVLPVGISFYTFQTLSYTLDVYRRQCKPHHDLLEFFAFVAFFPQLVAGPIVRGTEFLPHDRHAFDRHRDNDHREQRDGQARLETETM